MTKTRSRFGWFVISLAVGTILCFIGTLILNVVLGGLYHFDLLATPVISEWMCYHLLILMPLGVVGLIYQNTFIRSTYTDKERQVLQRQLLALTISAMSIALVIPLRQPILFFPASFLLALVGLSSITNRVAIILRHPLLVEAHNRGWSAILTGLLEIATAIVVLSWAIIFTK